MTRGVVRVQAHRARWRAVPFLPRLQLLRCRRRRQDQVGPRLRRVVATEAWGLHHRRPWRAVAAPTNHRHGPRRPREPLQATTTIRRDVDVLRRCALLPAPVVGTALSCGRGAWCMHSGHLRLALSHAQRQQRSVQVACVCGPQCVPRGMHCRAAVPQSRTSSEHHGTPGVRTHCTGRQSLSLAAFKPHGRQPLYFSRYMIAQVELRGCLEEGVLCRAIAGALLASFLPLWGAVGAFQA